MSVIYSSIGGLGNRPTPVSFAVQYRNVFTVNVWNQTKEIYRETINYHNPN